MILGLVDVYVLIASFNDDDDDSNDHSEKYFLISNMQRQTYKHQTPIN